MTVGDNVNHNHKQITTNTHFIKENTLFNKNKYHEMNYDSYLNDFNNDNSKSLTSNHTAHELGHGYDRADDMEGFSVFNSGVKVKMIPQSSTLSIQIDNNTKSLYKNLGINGNMRFGFKRFSVGGAAKYVHSVTNSSHQLDFIFHLSYLVDEELIFPDKDMYTSMALAETNNKAMFFSNYRDKYIANLMTERAVFFDLQMTSSSIKDNEAISGKIKFANHLVDIAAGINFAKQQNSNNLKISIQASTYPFNGDKTDNILPDNVISTLASGDATQVNNLFDQIKTNSYAWIYDFSKDEDKMPSNPLNWYPQAVSKNNLGNYSSLHGLFKSDTPIVNPSEKLIKDFPELNKYYDEKINLKEDMKNINFNYIGRNLPSAVSDYLSDMSETYNAMNILLTPGNTDFDNVFINHNDQTLLDDLKNTEQLLSIDGNFSTIKALDFTLHFQVHFQTKTKDVSIKNFNYRRHYDINKALKFDNLDNTGIHTQYISNFKDTSIQGKFYHDSIDIKSINFKNGLINFKKLSFYISWPMNPELWYTGYYDTISTNNANISWLKISDTYRSSVINFYDCHNTYLSMANMIPLDISAKCYFYVNINVLNNPDVLFYETV